MKILGMGVPELLIILAVILLIFGPKNLPKLGASVGKTVKSLREGLGGGEKLVEADDEEEAVEEIVEEAAQRLSGYHDQDAGQEGRQGRINQPILPLPRREPSLPRAQQPPAASVPWAVAHFEEGGRQARSDTASPL